MFYWLRLCTKNIRVSHERCLFCLQKFAPYSKILYKVILLFAAQLLFVCSNTFAHNIVIFFNCVWSKKHMYSCILKTAIFPKKQFLDFFALFYIFSWNFFKLLFHFTLYQVFNWTWLNSSGKSINSNGFKAVLILLITQQSSYIQVKCEVIETTSQDASDGWFQCFSFQSAACCLFRASEETRGEVLIQWSTHSV